MSNAAHVLTDHATPRSLALQPLTAVAEAARIAFTFVLLSAAILVVSLAGVAYWAGSALVGLFVREPERVIRPAATSRRG